MKGSLELGRGKRERAKSPLPYLIVSDASGEPSTCVSLELVSFLA